MYNKMPNSPTFLPSKDKINILLLHIPRNNNKKEMMMQKDRTDEKPMEVFRFKCFELMNERCS